MVGPCHSRRGALQNSHCSIAISAEHKSKFAVLHVLWWHLHMSSRTNKKFNQSIVLEKHYSILKIYCKRHCWVSFFQQNIFRSLPWEKDYISYQMLKSSYTQTKSSKVQIVAWLPTMPRRWHNRLERSPRMRKLGCSTYSGNRPNSL